MLVVSLSSGGEAVPTVVMGRAPFEELNLTDAAGLPPDEVLSASGKWP